MMGHQLALITLADRSEAAKWSCSCGACGFCYPDGWNADADLRAAALYAVAQDGHRRHVARALITEPAGRCGGDFPSHFRHYCAHRWATA